VTANLKIGTLTRGSVAKVFGRLEVQYKERLVFGIRRNWRTALVVQGMVYQGGPLIIVAEGRQRPSCSLEFLTAAVGYFVTERSQTKLPVTMSFGKNRFARVTLGFFADIFTSLEATHPDGFATRLRVMGSITLHVCPPFSQRLRE
jgi:hypothetical protein